jgi:hypothetical protein
VHVRIDDLLDEGVLNQFLVLELQARHRAHVALLEPLPDARPLIRANAFFDRQRGRRRCARRGDGLVKGKLVVDTQRGRW